MELEKKLRNTGSVWVDDAPDLTGEDRIFYQGKTTLRKYGEMENEVAKNVLRLKYESVPTTVKMSVVNDLIERFSKENHVKLHFYQTDAARMAVTEPISILTGGPGTGKTTVLRAIAYVLRSLNRDVKIAFTAPTGKAANRIHESVGEKATTLHKKLGLGYGNKPEPFTEDVLFIDESSMMDLPLAKALFSSIPSGKKVILVGDSDQLPSVGIGAVFRDLIDSGVVPTTRLTKTFRQSNKSVLFSNIQRIREGRCNFEEGDDFHSIPLPEGRLTPEQKNEIAVSIRNTYLSAVSEYGIDQVCLLLPEKKRLATISSNAMSPFIQKKVNRRPSGMMVEVDGRKATYKVGDLVMQLKNRKECANGDVGTVIKADERELLVDFSGVKVKYTPKEADQITLSYAMTIHKSQGSEYKCVIICLLDEHACLNRNLLYTGVTRAKKVCYLFTQKKALEKAVKVKADAERFSFLKEKLQVLDCKLCAAKMSSLA